jgi:hypothetical protein
MDVVTSLGGEEIFVVQAYTDAGILGQLAVEYNMKVLLYLTNTTKELKSRIKER